MNSETPRHVLRLAPGVEMAFRRIPPGRFRMGSRGFYPDEEPVHEVRIEEDLWLGETPVTQAQFALWTAAAKVEHTNEFAGNPDHPAENMSWRQAVSFCDWLTRTYAGQMPKDAQFACLPTEAEWEYACRGGTETEYYSGDGEAALAAVGWYSGNSENTTHPVAPRGEGHPFGLHDVHGNVWEWCHDVWDEAAYRGRLDGAADPGWSSRQQEWKVGLPALLKSSQPRVLRGGSWSDSARYCRSAYRIWYSPVDRIWFSGFRVCLVRGPKAGAEASPGPGDGGRGTRPESDGPGVAGAGKRSPRKKGRTPGSKPRPLN